jgi:hypothetical protein
MKDDDECQRQAEASHEAPPATGEDIQTLSQNEVSSLALPCRKRSCSAPPATREVMQILEALKQNQVNQKHSKFKARRQEPHLFKEYLQMLKAVSHEEAQSTWHRTRSSAPFNERETCGGCQKTTRTAEPYIMKEQGSCECDHNKHKDLDGPPIHLKQCRNCLVGKCENCERKVILPVSTRDSRTRHRHQSRGCKFAKANTCNRLKACQFCHCDCPQASGHRARSTRRRSRIIHQPQQASQQQVPDQSLPQQVEPQQHSSQEPQHPPQSPPGQLSLASYEEFMPEALRLKGRIYSGTTAMPYDDYASQARSSSWMPSSTIPVVLIPVVAVPVVCVVFPSEAVKPYSREQSESHF